ncbi:MAG TPA: hypothetical protein PLS53_00335 [Thermoanaerobaculaceae bacterium]|nr:hypothetical protein [Thermoanaerobaculaceae bacterium]HPS76581.1 hypothetical protein [Thermoanaerobaculaceae bacterium]
MNLLVPHTVLVISANRIRVDWLKPARVMGPGVYHFEGDLRPRLRTLSQTKAVARGFVEVRFMSGDTVAVLKELLKEANGNQARLEFVYGLAGRAGVILDGNVAVAPVGNLETGENPEGEPLEAGNPGDSDAAAIQAAAEAAAAAAKAQADEVAAKLQADAAKLQADAVVVAAAKAQADAAAAAVKAAEVKAAELSPSGDDEEIVVSDADGGAATIDLKEIGTASITKK